MAPSNMFSYLRPGHAKRNASSLASPEPVPSPAALPLPSPSQTTEYFSSPRLNDNASFVSNSPISPFPPQLPPIARVASKLDRPPPAPASQHSAGRPAPTTAEGASDVPRQEPAKALMSPPPVTRDQLSPAMDTGVPPVRPATGTPSVISPSYTSFSRSQTSLMGGISDKLSGTSKGPAPPAAAPVKGKSRLNLRNPMSLLMRRRSGQTLDPLADESLVSHRSPGSLPPMPDNYDPSIRGHIVHDFNAPRMNRNFSHNNAYGRDQPQPEYGRVSPQKIDREHTPVFREHFDDDSSYEQSQAAIRAEKLANNDFIARNSVQFPPPKDSPPPPPPLPKDSPPLPQPAAVQSPPAVGRPLTQTFESSSSVLSPVQETPDSEDALTDVTPRKRKSTKTPPPSRSRATSVTDPSFQPAGLPAHLTSRASRFSFQISSGADSAQEKILEDRHKQKAAEKEASKQVRMSTNTMEDEYDEYGMDDYDMDGGYEEEIPMLGEEDDFGGLGDQTMDTGINGFDFSNLSIQPIPMDPSSPMIAMGQFQTPVDANGAPIGFAMSPDMLQQLQQPQLGHASVSAGDSPMETLSGAQDPMASLPVHPAGPVPLENKAASAPLDLDDDMYFDDGMIGDEADDGAAGFDEDIFDDPDGPLFERKVKPLPATDLRDALLSHPPDNISSEAGYEADDEPMSKNLETSEPTLMHKNSVAHQFSVPSINNINAYHNALAEAATRAEAAGRFTRKPSTDADHSTSDAEDLSSLSNSRPSLVPDDGRFSLDTEGFPPDDDGFGMSSGFIDDYDYSEYDSALEDDPMIAAANAEALAYDDEGFYGQEFGFYASAVGDSPNTWGGFFGPSGLGRSVSGRNAMREPNLTPITERSEYSTRNSFISLNHFRDGQQPLSSPGLAQLARMSPYGWSGEDEEMSMDTLLKLRKGAFGGSVASLPGSTSNSPRNSSPMGMQFIPRTSSPAGNRMKEHSGSDLDTDESANMEDAFTGAAGDDEKLMDAVNAAYEDEDDSENSNGDERPESPTLTASDHLSLSSPMPQPPEDIPPLPSAAQLQALHSTQSASHLPLPMSPDGMSLLSPCSMPLPMSPYGVPLASPFVPQRSTGPPSIDTSLSSPSATISNSTGPRRQSVGFSPVSTSSPLTPSGSGWRAGHSRKGSAADSVTYVREHDEAGEGRWVLERRRTAESGELELIGREIVEGGRI